MKAGTNRPWRKDQSARARSGKERSPRHALAFLVIAATLAWAVAPAQAGTGGASTAAADLAQSGEGIAFSSPMRMAAATWYGPGLYGNHTACGQTLRPQTIGVAHRSLPCGTPVRFAYHGRYLVARVIDRGPFSRGNAWDLTNGARLALDFDGSDNIRYAIGLRYTQR